MRNAKRKMMIAGAAVAAASSFSLSQANAAFTVSASAGTVVGSNTVYYITALNTGGSTGTGLQGENLTIQSSGTGTTGALQFITNTDIDSDGHNDVNLLGAPTVNIKTNTAGTISRLGAVGNLLSPTMYIDPANPTVQASYRTNPSGTTAVSPGTGYTPTALSPAFLNGTVHWINYQMAISPAPADNSTPITIADVVVPTGTQVTISGSLGGNIGSFTPFTSVVVGGTSGSVTGSNRIIALAPTVLNGTAPNGYGTAPIGTLTSYNGGISTTLHPAGSANVSGYVSLVGTANGYALLALALNGNTLAPGASQLTNIVNDINASNAVGAVVIPTSGSPLSQYASQGFDIAVPLGSQATFAYDFSNVASSDFTDTDTALGAVSVTAIAAVPEPATAAGVILGAAGLLLGRRKTKVVA